MANQPVAAWETFWSPHLAYVATGNADTYHPNMTCQGAAFRFECDMADSIVGQIPFAFDFDPSQRMRLLREPAIGSVIPDMLLGIWSGDLPRWSGLNLISRHILAWLSTQKFVASEIQLCETLFLSSHAASSAVSQLERVGAVAKRESGEVFLRPDFDILNSVRLVAIEMKLRRWREALAQAIVYRNFADEAFVVLDGNQVRPNAELREAFTANGVGLFLHSSQDFISEIPAARTLPPPSADRLFALSKLTCGPYCAE